MKEKLNGDTEEGCDRLSDEFSKSHNLMIKPWCAWEIGNYYDIHPNKKYIVSFYKSSSIHPIIEKFKPMLKVRSGRIISK